MTNKEKLIDEDKEIYENYFEINYPSLWKIILIISGILMLSMCLIGLGVHIFAAEPVEDIYVEIIDIYEPLETMAELSTIEPLTEVEKITELETITEVPGFIYFDVPLSYDLQKHIFTVCESRGVDPAMVIAIIQKESRYDASAIGDNGNSLGLMQIQPRWHQARMNKLGCADLLDPYQNVTVGIDILAELQSMSESLDWILMSYNGGYAHANNHISNGTISDYASTVKTYIKTIERN